MIEINKLEDTEHNMENKYQDIIHLEHPTSSKHPRMNRIQRAAQFAPFAALTGHADEIQEVSRLTDSKIFLDEEQLVILNGKIQIINEYKHLEIPVKITYFVKDIKKLGGKYLDKTGIISKIDEFERVIIFKDKTKILIDDIIEIESDLLKEQFI